MGNGTSELKWELELERAAHRETQAHLQRALRAGMAWKMEVEGLRSGEPVPHPNPLLPACDAPGPGGDGAVDGDGGDVVVELVLAAIGALAHIGDRVLTEHALPGHPLAEDLMATVRHRVELLDAALVPVEGVGVVRTGGGGGATGAHTGARGGGPAA